MSKGRPATIIEIDLSDPSDSLEKIKYACTNQTIKKNILLFASQLLDGSDSRSSQTEFATKSLIYVAFHEDKVETFIDSVYDISKEMASYERSYMISLLISQMDEKDQVKMLFKFYEDLSLEGQSDMFGFLGISLNRELFNASKACNAISKDLNLEDLKKASKDKFYESCDSRLKTIIDYITENEHYRTENINFKSNLYTKIY